MSLVVSLFGLVRRLVTFFIRKLHRRFTTRKKVNPYEGHSFWGWLRSPSWKKFKLALANLMHTQWFYVALGIGFALFPWPWNGAYDFKDLIQDIFARLGLFYVASIFILGPPHFDIDDEPLHSQGTVLSILVFFLVLYFGSRYLF